jgi:K+-transporting ATPase ATPase C chain
MTFGRAHEEPPGDTSRSEIREARRVLVVTLVLALLAGALFPALVLGLSQVAFPHQAGGNLLRERSGQVIGSELIGQGFSEERYFHGRPSGAGLNGFDAAASSGVNLGPTNRTLLNSITERAADYRAENSLPDELRLPADAVTSSASGLDPHISKANALLQAPRVARARGMTEAAVRDLVEEYLESPALGFFGESRVNVLKLNLALDEATR